MKYIFTLLQIGILLSASFFGAAQVVIVNDSTFNTADQMFLANELFESGEPFAEDLGYDLDDLDPMVQDAPDSVAYATGIENYEYSRYLLNTVNGRSGLGLNAMWSPVVMANAANQPDSFDGMFTGGEANGYKEDDMLIRMIGSFGKNANQTPPARAFPQFADFMEGNSHLPQIVAPDFQTDFGTTRWDRSKMKKTLNLGAMGQSMWKQYFWAQDMLGAFHDSNEEEVVPTGDNSPDSTDSPILDPSNDIFYGGNNVDGFIGQVLTAVSINKTALLINRLAFDGNQLGAVDPATYDPAGGILYFPNKIAVVESEVIPGLPPQASEFSVIDSSSNLFDQLSFLLATTSYRNMMNPAISDDEAHLAYREVFDGYPFPADASVTGTPGPFDLMSGAGKVIFLNIMTMHFNSDEGSFVDNSQLDASGQPSLSETISAENAGYIIVALAKFSKEYAGTPLQAMADSALLKQADFILNRLQDQDGGYYNSYTMGSGANTEEKSLAANAGIIRGLYAAYDASGNDRYLTAANAAYNYLINNFYLPGQYVFRTRPTTNTATYSPRNLALIAGALREARLVGQQIDAVNIYTRFFKKVYNPMLLAEAEASGETGEDSDNDGIPYVAGGTRPFVFAAEAEYDLTTTSTF